MLYHTAKKQQQANKQTTTKTTKQKTQASTRICKLLLDLLSEHGHYTLTRKMASNAGLLTSKQFTKGCSVRLLAKELQNNGVPPSQILTTPATRI